MAKEVKTSELKKGDNVRIEYGIPGNFVPCTIVEVSEKLLHGYHVVKAFAACFVKPQIIEFCAKPDDLIEVTS